MRFVIRLVVTAVAIWLASLLVPGIELAPSESLDHKLLILLVVSLIFTVINLIIRPIVKLFALPLYLLTIGLFFLVVNALMLMLTGWVSAQSEFALHVSGFWSALLGGIVISAATWVVNVILPKHLETKR